MAITFTDKNVQENFNARVKAASEAANPSKTTAPVAAAPVAAAPVAAAPVAAVAAPSLLKRVANRIVAAKDGVVNTVKAHPKKTAGLALLVIAGLVVSYMNSWFSIAYYNTKKALCDLFGYEDASKACTAKLEEIAAEKAKAAAEAEGTEEGNENDAAPNADAPKKPITPGKDAAANASQAPASEASAPEAGKKPRLGK